MNKLDVALQTLTILQRDNLSQEEIVLRGKAIRVIEESLLREEPKAVVEKKAPKKTNYKKGE